MTKQSHACIFSWVLGLEQEGWHSTQQPSMASDSWAAQCRPRQQDVLADRDALLHKLPLSLPVSLVPLWFTYLPKDLWELWKEMMRGGAGGEIFSIYYVFWYCSFSFVAFRIYCSIRQQAILKWDLSVLEVHTNHSCQPSDYGPIFESIISHQRTSYIYKKKRGSYF